MGFFLFLGVTAILIVRPTDFLAGMEGAPLYLIAIIPCIILSWHKLVPQLTVAGLTERPVFALGIGLMFVSIVTNLAHGQVAVGFTFAMEFAKILTFYALLLANVDSPNRLKVFSGFLVAFVLIPITLALVDYHGYVKLDGFNKVVEGEVRRLSAAGSFADPNDVCEIINCALILGLCGLLHRSGGCTRVLWLGPTALFAYALAMTHSRGGFLGSAVGLMVLFARRFQGIRALLVAVVVLALMILLFRGGRQTSFSTSEGTSQTRIQLWDAGFEKFKRSPLIGVGHDQFVKDEGHVAHNAYIQVCAEMGFLGGTLLFGQYYYCLTSLARLGSKRVNLPDPEMHRLQPFVLAAFASFATSEMSLTNPFGPFTYTMFGLATAFIRLADPIPALPAPPLNWLFVRRIIVFSGVLLVSLYVFVRLTVSYG